MKALWAMPFLLLFCGSAFAHGTFSDSLVKNLDCSTLSQETVLSSLQPDAFSSEREIPIKNWGSLLFPAGQCWGLTHAQRILYYLGRFGQGESAPMAELASYFRGNTTPDVFPVSKDFFSQLESSSEFRSSIESYEAHRVFSSSNVKMMGVRDRSKPENAAVFAQLQSELAKNRLPIISLRFSPVLQHIVLVKSISTTGTPGLYRFGVYNSQAPNEENQVLYSETEQEFYAPEIIQVWDKTTPENPIGIFIVDEGDMEQIQEILLKYYTAKCRAD